MHHIFLALFFFLQVSAVAQEKTSSKDVLLRFTSFGLKDIGGKYTLVAAEKSTTAFTIPHNGFSVPVTAPAKGGNFALVRSGSDTFRSLATIKLPDTGKRFLVLVFPAKGGLLKTAVLRADDPAFRPSHIMIINLARETFAGDLGGKKIRFAPGSRTIFRPKRKGQLANFQVRFYMIKNDKPKIFAASLWPYFENKRAFVFLFRDPVTGSPSYRSIDEFTGWLEK